MVYVIITMTTKMKMTTRMMTKKVKGVIREP